jgi:hypothetical protein
MTTPAPVDHAPLIRLVVDKVLPEEEDLPAFYADAHHQRQDERRRIRRELLAVADNHQAVCDAAQALSGAQWDALCDQVGTELADEEKAND